MVNGTMSSDPGECKSCICYLLTTAKLPAPGRSDAALGQSSTADRSHSGRRGLEEPRAQASRIAAKNARNPLSEENCALSPDERCSTRPLNRRRPGPPPGAEVHDEGAAH